MNFRRFFVGTLFLLGCCSIESFGQDIKLAGIGYANYPTVALKDDADGYETSFQEFGGFFSLPQVLKDGKIILINGFSYGFVKSKMINTIQGKEASKLYHRIGYSLTTVYRLGDSWLFSGRVAPTLASDLEQSLSRDDVIILGSLIATKKVNEQTKYGGGLIYTTRLGRPLLLPLVQYSHEVNRHSINVFLPALIRYNYSFGKSDEFGVGFKIAPNGANFNASEDNFANVVVDKLNYVRINIGPEFNYMITDMLQLEVSGGLSARRTYKYFDTQGDSYDYNSKNGAFVSVSLSVIPPMGDKKKK
ncbi:MAG: hypothetical protein CMB89_02705 [Flammeovirgaceae bacterium]|nr:hypothetical protein [Flammeovirgaceae bacterium]